MLRTTTGALWHGTHRGDARRSASLTAGHFRWDMWQQPQCGPYLPRHAMARWLRSHFFAARHHFFGIDPQVLSTKVTAHSITQGTNFVRPHVQTGIPGNHTIALVLTCAWGSRGSGSLRCLMLSVFGWGVSAGGRAHRRARAPHIPVDVFTSVITFTRTDLRHPWHRLPEGNLPTDMVVCCRASLGNPTRRRLLRAAHDSSP